MRPTPLPDNAAFLINNSISLNFTALGSPLQLLPNSSQTMRRNEYSVSTWASKFFKDFQVRSLFFLGQHNNLPTLSAVPKVKSVKCISTCCIWIKTLPVQCYQPLPGGSRPPLRAKTVPSLMQRVFLIQVSAWLDLKKGTGCTTCSPWPECQNHTSCIIWQVIIIKVLKSQQIHVTARSGLHESIQSDISATFVSTETKPFLSALDCLCNRCIIERAFVKKVCQWNKSDRLKLTKKG